MELDQKVLSYIRRQRLFKPGSTLVLGISGGPDSVVLLHILHHLRHEIAARLHIAHFNHKLRKTSDRDEEFVRQLALKLNIPFFVGCAPKRLSKRAVSEERARTWRFDFFAKLSRQLGADGVVLAHNQNDVSETVLMRLIRGSGLHGLRAILPLNDVDGIKIIRPLVDISRVQIEEYIVRHRLSFCIDETNAQTEFFRNKLRLKLLPLLIKEYNPKISDALVDLSKTAIDDYDFLSLELAKRIKKDVVTLQGKVKISIVPFIKEHCSMQRLLLRHAFSSLTGDSRLLTFDNVTLVIDLVKFGQVGAIVDWPRSVKVVKKKETLEIFL